LLVFPCPLEPENAELREWLERLGKAFVAARSLSSAGGIERAPTVPIPVETIDWDLGPGESTVIGAAVDNTTNDPAVQVVTK